jgi:hypothetical protein
MPGEISRSYKGPKTGALPTWMCDHAAAKEVIGSQQDGYPCGDTVTILCPDCGKEWECELPQ